jgi:hypothetical protein
MTCSTPYPSRPSQPCQPRLFGVPVPARALGFPVTWSIRSLSATLATANADHLDRDAHLLDRGDDRLDPGADGLGRDDERLGRDDQRGRVERLGRHWVADTKAA